MPYVEPMNPQFCTFEVATNLADKLIAIGIVVETIFEITEEGKFDTTSEQYQDDEQNHQYVAKIWDGPEQNLGMTQAMFAEKGYNWETFTKLALTSNVPDTTKAILELKNIYPAINATLEREMT